MNTTTFSIFEGKRTISVPTDIIEQYEDMVGRFNQNTVNHLAVVLNLSEEMSNEALSVKIIESMLEDCEDSLLFAKIIQNQETAKNLLEGKCCKLDSETS